MKNINIAKEFSETPLGRFADDSLYNGTTFRESFLRPALDANSKVAVVIDGVEGYGSSFLEEAFGGLVRKGYYTSGQLAEKLEIRFEDVDFSVYRDLIWKYINEAKMESKS